MKILDRNGQELKVGDRVIMPGCGAFTQINHRPAAESFRDEFTRVPGWENVRIQSRQVTTTDWQDLDPTEEAAAAASERSTA